MLLKAVAASVGLRNTGSCQEGSPGSMLPVRVNTQPSLVRWQSDPAGSNKKVRRMQIMMIRALRAVQKNQTTLLITNSFSFSILFQKVWHPLFGFPFTGVNQLDLLTALRENRKTTQNSPRAPSCHLQSSMFPKMSTQSSTTPSPVLDLSTVVRFSPSILFNCSPAICIEAADANPEMTGMEMKSIKKPN